MPQRQQSRSKRLERLLEDEEAFRAAFIQYAESRHATLFGFIVESDNESGMADAAEWVRALVNGIAEL